MNSDQCDSTKASAKRLLDALELEVGFRSMIAASFADPDTVGIEQETEMRRAFFAGARCCLCYLESGLTIGDLQDECRVFINGVKVGLR